MITTGSKLLIGSAVLATVYAVVYGLTREGILGTIGLVSAAAALIFLAGINVYTRDANVAVDEAGATTVSAAARQAPSRSIWPLAAALGAATVLVGVVSYPPVTIAGFVLILAAALEWMVQAWAERGSDDAVFNARIRDRIASPLEMPIIGAIGGGLVIFFFSRVMLSLTKVGTVVVFSILATLVLFVAFVVASRPKVSAGTLTGVVGIVVVALVAGGATAAFTGERDIPVLETTADLAERGRCGVEKTEADKKASQTIAARSNLTAEVTLRADGQLTHTMPGFDHSQSALQMPRSNPNNILFVNDSDEARRLVIDLGGLDGEDGRVVCTQLAEPGGVQFLTLIFDNPTFAVGDDAHRFTVPGVDTAVLDVVIP